MRGHDSIIAMRRRRVSPTCVWFTVADACDVWRDWPSWTAHGQVWVEPGDSVPLLDLRFVVGLECWVDGTDERRVLQLHEACVQAKASRVLTAIQGQDHRGRPSTVRMLDTAGVCVMEAA